MQRISKSQIYYLLSCWGLHQGRAPREWFLCPPGEWVQYFTQWFAAGGRVRLLHQSKDQAYPAAGRKPSAAPCWAYDIATTAWRTETGVLRRQPLAAVVQTDGDVVLVDGAEVTWSLGNLESWYEWRAVCWVWSFGFGWSRRVVVSREGR